MTPETNASNVIVKAHLGILTTQHVWLNGVPTKRRRHRLSENVGQQRDIFWPVRVSLWRVVTFKSSLGAARHPHHGLPPCRGGGAYAPMTRTIFNLN